MEEILNKDLKIAFKFGSYIIAISIAFIVAYGMYLLFR